MPRFKSRTWIVLPLLAAAFVARAQPPQQKATADLGGTSWQLVKFQSSDGTTLTPDDRTKYTITFEADGGVSTRIDCNRGRGTWKSQGPNKLEFGPLALTRAQCPPGSLHDRVARDWTYIRSYTLKDGDLYLALIADGGIYEFEPASVASHGPVTYDCTRAGGGNDTLAATFYQTRPALVLVKHENETRPGFQVRSADGAKYEGPDLMFWEARGEATVTWSSVELKCKPR